MFEMQQLQDDIYYMMLKNMVEAECFSNGWNTVSLYRNSDGTCEDETPVYGFRDREIIGEEWENDHVFCRRTDFSFLSVGLVCRYTEVCAAANFALPVQ